MPYGALLTFQRCTRLPSQAYESAASPTPSSLLKGHRSVAHPICWMPHVPSVTSYIHVPCGGQDKVVPAMDLAGGTIFDDGGPLLAGRPLLHRPCLRHTAFGTLLA